LNFARRNGEIQQPEETTETPSDKELLEYIASVHCVQKYTNEIQEHLSRLFMIREEIIIAVGQKEKTISMEIEGIVDSVLNLQQKANAVLKDLNKKLTTAKQEDAKNENSETRIKANLYGAYCKLFQETISKFEDLQTEIKGKMQGKVLRDAEIVLARKIDPAEREAVLSDQGYVQKLLSDKLTGAGHIKLQNTVSDLEDRYKDIVKLENSVNQVHKLFMEMAVLVQHQGEIIDNIELNIKEAKGHCIKAEKHLVDAKNNIISARKKKCCILMIVIVVLLVIVMPILGVKVFSA